jgi:hypothetical protein
MSIKEHHDPIRYIGEFNDRNDYNDLLREYLGIDAYNKATSINSRPIIQKDEDHEFVTRETILRYIAINRFKNGNY